MVEKHQQKGDRDGDRDGNTKKGGLFGKEFIAGSLAGAAGVVLGHPLDTVKTRIQTSDQYTSTWRCFRDMTRSEGVRSFYRGLSWPFLSKSIEQCLLFGLNDQCRKLLPEFGFSEDGDSLVVASGAIAGLVTFATLTPIYVVKVQLQICPQDRIQAFSGPLQCASFNWKRFITYEKVVSQVSTTMQYAEEKMQHFYHSEHRHSSSTSTATTRDMISQIIGGGIAGMATWASIYPLDVVMSKMQAQGAQKKFENKRQGMFWHMRKIYEKGGTRAFFKGLEPCLLRAFPVNAVMFLTYEQTLKWM